MANRVVEILMRRDNITLEEAENLVAEAEAEISQAIADGDFDVVDDIMCGNLGLEMDYIDDVYC